MKQILLILLSLACGCAARAAEFSFKYDQLPGLVAAFNALDGYEHSVDQGPGNPARVVREPYKFTSDTRARLGADRAVIAKALDEFLAQLGELRLKISGDREKIDATNPKQLEAWKAAAAPFETGSITLDLSPITAAELCVNDNPIPISVLSVLNLLRPAPAK